VADEGDVMLCRAAKELPGAAGKSGIIADWGLRPAPLSNARYRSLSDHADISQHQTATDHFSSQPAYGQRVVTTVFNSDGTDRATVKGGQLARGDQNECASLASGGYVVT